jgi:hypothetical protein
MITIFYSTFSLFVVNAERWFWNYTKSCVLRSRTLPPIGNFTLPRRHFYSVVFPAIITSTIFGSNELKKVRKHFGNQGFFRMVGRQVDKVILFPQKQGSKCGKMDKKERRDKDSFLGFCPG